MRRAAVAVVVVVLAIAAGAQAQAQISASDDFERGSLGSNWTTFGRPGIVNHSDLGLWSGSIAHAFWVPPVSPDQSSEGVISANANPAMTFQVFVRGNPLTLSRYAFHYQGQWELKYDATGGGVIASTSTYPAPRAGDRLRITAQGTTLRGFLNGVQILSALDSRIASGKPGLAFRSPTNVSQPVPVFESWSGSGL